MKAFWMNLFTLAFWLAVVMWLIGCSGCGHTSPGIDGCPASLRSTWDAEDIGFAVYANRYDHIADRVHCRIVDRIESGGPGMPDWIVFDDDNDNPIPLSYFPDATEGSGICVEPSPADVADLGAPDWVFDCAEQGIDPLDCHGPNGGAL